MLYGCHLIVSSWASLHSLPYFLVHKEASGERKSLGFWVNISCKSHRLHPETGSAGISGTSTLLKRSICAGLLSCWISPRPRNEIGGEGKAFVSPVGRLPTVLVHLGLRSFLACGTFSAQTRTVPGQLGWLVPRPLRTGGLDWLS